MKKRLLTILMLAVIACVFCACGGNDDQTGNEPAEFLSDYDISGVSVSKDSSVTDVTYGSAKFIGMKLKEGDYSMKFRIYVPEYYDTISSLPVLMFFHGAGERGDNNLSQISSYSGFRSLFTSGDSPVLDSIVIAPQCPLEEKWVDVPSWYADAQYSTDQIPESKALATALKILKYYSQEYSVDTGSIYAMGLSMGGYATWDLLVRHTDILAAGIPICGGCDTSQPGLLVDKPIYTFHGSADTVVSPIGTQTMYRELIDLGGASIKYVEYNGAGHSVWDAAMQTDGLMDWLYSQK